MNIKYCLMVILGIITTTECKKNDYVNEKTNNEYQLFQFKEIGNKDLLTTEFPQQWKVSPSSDSPQRNESDVNNETKLNNLDYFDDVKGRLKKSKEYISILSEKESRIDSIFVIDSIFNKTQSFVYLKSFKTIENSDYDFPPTVQQIDILVFQNSNFLRKLNVYTKKTFPFTIDLKLGFFDKAGNLLLKQFKTDEESTIFTKEESFKLSVEGKIIIKNSRIPKEYKKDILNQNGLKKLDFIGNYKMNGFAISNSNGEKISLGYFITIKSLTKAVLSIDAKYSEDYGCEGEYKLINENNILHARGKCDQDNIDDFYIKFEGNRYYLKSKRFINQDWQELKKEQLKDKG